MKLPPELPILQREEDILKAIQENQVVIIRGETGSGKTTQIPKICLKAGLGERKVIGCTQPRRVAAHAVASRIAEEIGAEGKRLVGTKMRFTDGTSKQTRIKIMTDGILLNEMQSDPLLRRYSVIVVDEAHERSLNIDFILGHLIQIRKKRKDLKIIVTSATIDTKQFSKAFGGAPVIEVSGRMFPVEVRYRPFEESDRGGDYTYIEGSYDAIEEVLHESREGDLLVFLPAEKDIRELCDRLRGSFQHFCEIVPLFGRLTQAEQQQIFKNTQKRKIVVATNIAETSITVPGIRYVVDAGYARISRYSSHTRTQRLPIEPIAQSSANQRMGRCGRVAEGVCIRLYSEEDYHSRPEFVPPEIFRSNLASVILRLKAFDFGSIEDFPFLDRPDDRAIQGGMILLKELRAIDEVGELTEIGRTLARLPIDPTIGRMLLEAKRRSVQRSVLIIASALSIQDPRERPLEKEKIADKEHQKFAVKDSDFLSLRKIWMSFDEKYEKWTQSKMRKFCRQHFISYQRLREWREIHAQIRYVLMDLGEMKDRGNEEKPDDIHQSILAGLIGNVGLKEEGNWYRATRGRKVMVFPGSVMFEKEKPNPKKDEPKAKKPKIKRKEEWIVAGEFVETSRLFARTVAKVDSRWIRELGEHLLHYSYAEPHWADKAQRVLVWQKEFLYGLLIHRTRVGFSTVDPKEAKEIFVRNGILEGKIRDRFPFIENQKRLMESVMEMQSRFRQSLVFDLEEKLYRFYDSKLPQISSVAELHQWWRGLSKAQQEEMLLSEEDILERVMDAEKESSFPEKVDLAGTLHRLEYRFAPGEKNDGATLSLPLSEFSSIREGSLDWMVPGFVADKIEQLIKGLPKDYRRHLMPIREKCDEILAKIEPSPRSLIKDLGECIDELYDLRIPERAWDLSVLPDYVRLKVQLVDDSGKPIAESSEWEELKEKADQYLSKTKGKAGRSGHVDAWQKAVRQWEKRDVQDWTFPDLPKMLPIGTFHGIPLIAYPGLSLSEDGMLSVKLFRDEAEAKRFTPTAYRKLCEWGLGREIGWFQKDLNKLKSIYVYFSDLYAWDDFKEDLYRSVMGSLFAADLCWPLTKANYTQAIEHGKKRLRAIVFELEDLLGEISESRSGLGTGEFSRNALCIGGVKRLFPPRFLRIYDLNQLMQLPRFLKALDLRLRRQKQNPQKDEKKAERLQPLLLQYQKVMQKVARVKKPAVQRMLKDVFFLLEEYRVSVFAQELGTSLKVSDDVIQKKLSKIEELVS
ncbi:MAG: ATP-dependent RNA helicase HrpA [Opitutales bacterium]|nr:ATP-dependent RNA helicase HrpA [Opitutales bacterium]